MTSALKGYKLIGYYLGVFLMMIGCIILFPLIMLIFYPQDAEFAYCFIIPGVTAIFCGYLLHYFTKKVKIENLAKHQDSLLVVLIWLLTITWSAFPWMLTGKYNFTQSIFECTSGYSTTGLSVCDIPNTANIFLFYRSVMLFVGGIGLVLVLTCAISDRYGLRLYNAEGHNDKLLPNLAKSARMILLIYSTYIILGTIAYMIAGMNLFDAVNHSIAALSTGGFSTKAENIFYYHSVAIDLISVVLMILGNTNFLIHMYLFRGQIKKIWKHCEVRFFVFFTLAILPIFTLILFLNDYANFGVSLNVSLFQYVSCMSTTGFQNIATMKELPHSFLGLLTFVMLIGGGMGSTAGGIKQYRIVSSIKGMYYGVKDQMFPNKMISSHYIARFGEVDELSKDEIHMNYTFVLIYLTIFFIGSFIFSLFGYSMEESMFEFASSLGTVGVSIGITGYNAHPVILWTSTVGMFLGRLEIIVVFNALARIKKDIVRKF